MAPGKKIYRTWRDELPLWSLYAFIGASFLAVIFLVAPPVFIFLKRLDWKFFARDQYKYLRWIFQGLVMTLRLSAVSMVFSLLLGTLIAIGRLSHSRFIRGICAPYIEFFRNTPLLIQLFFWYFGTSTLLDALAALINAGGMIPGAAYLAGRVLALKTAYNQGSSEFISGVVGLTVYTSAFIAETVRAGIQAIPHGQTEAARSSGLTTAQTLRLVILPQAFRIIIPPLLSQFLALTKNSSQAMAIGVAEVTYMARQVEANTFKGFEAFSVATALYMMISFLMSWALNRYNQAISIAEMGRKRQQLLAARAVRYGYFHGRLFAGLAAASGVLVFYRGAVLLQHGSWPAGLSLYGVGFILATASLVAVRRPEWGVGYIKASLVLWGTTLFFDLLQRLDVGLTAFDDVNLQGILSAPQILREQILLPLGWFILFLLAAVSWWFYFTRREVLFLRGGGR